MTTAVNRAENFRGDAAIYDGLILTNDQVVKYAAEYPNPKNRNICITDGEDMKSSKENHQALRLFRYNDVAVDGMCLGNED
jgi:hypothetical protein